MSSAPAVKGNADRRRLLGLGCVGATIAALAFALTLSASPADAALTCGGAVQVGTNGSEYIGGDESSNLVLAFAGNDRLDGFGGPDCLAGMDGEDVIFGGKQPDLLYGGTGSDYLYGGEDNDELHGDDGDDVLYGGRGADLLDGGAGYDVCIRQQDGDPPGQPPNCEVVINDAEVSLKNEAMPTPRTLTCQTAGLGAYLPGGTAGNDVISGDPGGPRVDLIIAFEGFDTVRGYALSDCIVGTSGADWLNGGPENDWITGGADSDTIYGGDGNDVLYGADPTGGEDPNQNNIDLIDGGAGDDWINGGPGTDEIYGGSGYDACRGGGDPQGKADDKFHGCEVVKQD